MPESLSMELGTIRSQFIQHSLRRAMRAVDGSVANATSTADRTADGNRWGQQASTPWKTAYEFRRYFEWYAGSISQPDRELISYQLRLLEDSCQGTQKQASTESTHH